MTSDDLQKPTPAWTLAPVLAGAWGAGVCGLLVAALTLSLNPHLRESWTDRLTLSGLMALGYGGVGAVLGLGATFVLRALGGRRPKLAAGLERIACDALAFAPLVYVCLLPDAGIVKTLLTRLIFGNGVAGLLLLLLALVAAGLLLGFALRRLERLVARRAPREQGTRTPPTPRRMRSLRRMGAVALPALALTLGFAAAGLGGSPAAPETPTEAVVPDPAARSGAPVLLVCIDGADLQVLEPMMERGDLPTFSRLREEGVWGPLETFYPSLSPVIWTTMVTGRAPEDHGIHGFLVHRLPGMERPIQRFPVHTGLNFRLFPLLERIPSFPTLRSPYTSNMRRVRALWNIVGDHEPVGIYRWRVTWPAEPIRGFNLTEGVALLGGAPGASVQLENPAIHPPELAADLPRPELEPVILPYVETLEGLDGRDRRLQAIRGSQERKTIEQLLYLLDRFQPMLTVASFYPVDGFNHLFGRDRRDGGRFAPAIAERYRFIDARLGELLAGLSRSTNVLVVSDHGYDYELDHHTHAPPGVLFGIGPDLERGARVELSVYDVTPLLLHLLGYPAAEDMPASARRRYLEAVTPPLRATARPPIASYGKAPASDWSERVSPQLEQTLEELRALGYVD